MGTPDRPRLRHASMGAVSHPSLGTCHNLPGVPPLLTISSRSSFLMVTFASSFSLGQEMDKPAVTNSPHWPLPRSYLGREAGRSDRSQHCGARRGRGKGRDVTQGSRCLGRVPSADKLQERHCPGGSADRYLSCLAFCSRDLRSPITDIACQNERGHPAARHRHRRASAVVSARLGPAAGSARPPTLARSRPAAAPSPGWNSGSPSPPRSP